LFFKKLKKEFPEIQRKKYESPHKEWILSEIVAVIILNDKRMTDILDNHNNGYYPKHRELKINGEFLTKLVEDIYEKYVVQDRNFTDFIQKSLELFKDIK
jgi:Asp-tRNA(Asn)/Glu-tRNA(Gln) amidotransferase B subunit